MKDENLNSSFRLPPSSFPFGSGSFLRLSWPLQLRGSRGIPRKAEGKRQKDKINSSFRFHPSSLPGHPFPCIRPRLIYLRSLTSLTCYSLVSVNRNSTGILTQLAIAAPP